MVFGTLCCLVDETQKKWQGTFLYGVCSRDKLKRNDPIVNLSSATYKYHYLSNDNIREREGAIIKILERWDENGKEDLKQKRKTMILCC